MEIFEIFFPQNGGGDAGKGHELFGGGIRFRVDGTAIQIVFGIRNP